MEVEWGEIGAEKASNEQRRALYRLGANRSLVAKLDTIEADRLIKQMLAFRQQLDPKRHELLKTADEILRQT